jgi:hypothetical protein
MSLEQMARTLSETVRKNRGKDIRSADEQFKSAMEPVGQLKSPN